MREVSIDTELLQGFFDHVCYLADVTDTNPRWILERMLALVDEGEVVLERKQAH